MKTNPMRHQLDALDAMWGREYFALLSEQGTGKTWVLLADAERLYMRNQIDALLVVAPKGVHTNWIRREIPKHLGAESWAVAYRSSPNRNDRQRLERVLRMADPSEREPLRVLAINYESLPTKGGRAAVDYLLAHHRTYVVLDESQRIKSHNKQRSNAALALRSRAVVRRISTGTPITNQPPDIFTQFEFLHSGLLGTTSYRAFVAEYAVLLPPTHKLVASIKRSNPYAEPQIVARDALGAPKWRNLERLSVMVQRHSIRALKRDCLDLPEKVRTTIGYDPTPQQRAACAALIEERRLVIDDELIAVSDLTAALKLRQILSGFLLTETGVLRLMPAEENPRLQALLDCVSDLEGQFIVWAMFREELAQISAALRAAGVSAVEYHGGVNTQEREKAVDDFQAGRARAFIGQPQAGGLGLTLTAAATAIYYSIDFNLGTRLQSEDRCHRIGTQRSVLYVDLVAEDTIDERMALALQRKAAMAGAILAD